MHEYDAALKLLLQASTNSVLRQIAGFSVQSWMNPELLEVQTTRADLLGSAAGGRLVHIELQSKNLPDMALRMAEYALRIYRYLKQFPKQVVLYAGQAKINMPAALGEPDSAKPDLAFQYTLIDRRELDSEPLLASLQIEDNVLAILTRLRDRRAAIRRILQKIASLEAPARRAALDQFLVISNLRRLAPAIEEEAQKMPILDDIMDHEVLGPAIRKGMKQGRREGLREGMQAGRQEILTRQLQQRFGAVPKRIKTRLEKLSIPELAAAALRLLNADSLDELFPRKS